MQIRGYLVYGVTFEEESLNEIAHLVRELPALLESKLNDYGLALEYMGNRLHNLDHPVLFVNDAYKSFLGTSPVPGEDEGTELTGNGECYVVTEHIPISSVPTVLSRTMEYDRRLYAFCEEFGLTPNPPQWLLSVQVG